MSQIDAILLITFGGFVLAGLWFGLIHMVGSLVGFVLGALVASHGYDIAAKLWNGWFGGNLNLERIIAFFLLFVITTRLVGLVAYLAEKALNLVSFIPFVKTFNRLAGAVLGFVEGSLILGLVIYFASRFPVSAQFSSDLQNSMMAQAVFAIGALLAPLMPQAIQMLNSVM